MLVYAKLIDGKQHLFGTMGHVPSDSDKELVYQNRDGQVVDLIEKDSYNDAPNFKMEDTSEVKRFSNSMTRLSDGQIVDAFIEDAESGELFNIIPGGVEAGPQKEITKIEVKTPPIKSRYDIGEKLSLAGIEVEVTYEDEEKKIITSGFTSNPAEGTVFGAEGEVTVTVSYKGKEASFEVNVVDSDKVDIYFELTNEKPERVADLTEKTRESAKAIKEAGVIDRFGIPDNQFTCLAFPKSLGQISKITFDDQTFPLEYEEIDDGDNYLIVLAQSTEPEGYTWHFCF